MGPSSKKKREYNKTDKMDPSLVSKKELSKQDTNIKILKGRGMSCI